MRDPVATARGARLSGRPEQAAALLQRALDAGSPGPELLEEVGLTAAALGDIGSALGALLRALDAAPALPQAGRLLCNLLEHNQVTDASLSVARVIEALFDRPDVNWQSLARTALNVLAERPHFARALAVAATPREVPAWAALDDAFYRDGLCLKLLERSINRSPELERLLTGLRREFLLHDGDLSDAMLSFAVALAQQMQNNEFVCPETAEEKEAVASVARRLRTGPVERDLLRFLMYRPAAQVPDLEALALGAWRSGLAQLLGRAVIERRQEAELGAALESFGGALGDRTSSAVQAHYEDNPYPRWFRLTLPEPGSRAATVDFLRGAAAGRDPLAVLVAGGGTGAQSVSLALAYGPRAEVLAIDLSRASLAYSCRKAREYDAANLRHLRGDLLEVGSLGRAFDVIECAGVLNHVADPLEALRRLAGALRPGGLAYLALYSGLARQDVVAVRRLIAERGFGDEPDEMRRFRGELVASPPSPARDGVVSSPGFYSLSACRDFLFHRVEHRFTMGGLADLVAGAGLRHCAWDLPPGVETQFRRRFGPRAALGDFSLWSAFEQERPRTFRGMYRIWCRKP